MEELKKINVGTKGKHQNNVWKLFKFDNKNTRAT